MVERKDVAGFKGSKNLLNDDRMIIIDYWFETFIDPEIAASGLCSEQSTAQWSRPGVDEDLRIEFGAKFFNLEVLSESVQPLYPFEWLKNYRHFKQCRVQIAHPHRNIGDGLPNLLAAIAGEGAFYCPGMSTVRISDIHFPHSYLQNFQGPQFGINGLRQLTGVHGRPFFIGVVKPNIGLSPKDFAQIAYESWSGGLDIVKDDEMLANVSWSPLEERSTLCHQARLRAEKETGHPKIFIANLTDEVDRIPELYRIASKTGTNTVMIDGFFNSFSALRSLRRISSLPIMGHFTGMALYDRIPGFGIDGRVLIKIQRLAGCDILAMPGFGDRMQTVEDEVLANIRACTEDMGPIQSCLPVPGGSDWAGSLEGIFEKVGSADFGLIAGRGVFRHPQGAKYGALSLHEAWEAIQKRISLKEYAQDHEALRQALESFGP